VLRRIRPLGAKPVRRPVERAEERAGRHRGIAAAQLAAAHAAGDERADAALVPIAFRDDERPQTGRKRVDLQVRRRTFHVVYQAPDVRGGEVAQAPIERRSRRAGAGKRGEQPVERAILAEEEELLLAAEVVIKVRGGEVGGDGDLAHPCGSESAGAEDASGGAEDVEPAGLGAALHPRRAVLRARDRTAVRKANHGSIVTAACASVKGGPIMAMPW